MAAGTFIVGLDTSLVLFPDGIHDGSLGPKLRPIELVAAAKLGKSSTGECASSIGTYGEAERLDIAGPDRSNSDPEGGLGEPSSSRSYLDPPPLAKTPILGLRTLGRPLLEVGES